MRLSREIERALDAGAPVVALESTVIAHGLPQPTNLETARRMEEVVRQHGAVPATIAVLGGKLCVGLTEEQLEHLATASAGKIRKASRRDLPVVVAQGGDGATTVAATMTIAAWAGIEVFATGGIGGVHRDPAYDISNDLPTLASVPVAVVCSGAKSILDLRATVEWLETAGVPVIGFGTSEFPAFYSRRSGLPVDARVDSPEAVAAIIRASRSLRDCGRPECHSGESGGTLVTVPVPPEHELPPERLEPIISALMEEARAQGIEGAASTPYLLNRIVKETGGASLRANVALLENNAAVAAEIALALKGNAREP